MRDEKSGAPLESTHCVQERVPDQRRRPDSRVRQITALPMPKMSGIVAAKKKGRESITMSSSNASDPVVQSAARWFWWIAGLSLVNTVLFFAGSDTSFVIGLAMTTLASAAFADNLPVAIVLAGLTIGFYYFVGLQAERHKLWAFYAGLVVYIADGLLYVLFEDWMSVGFHALAAFFIVKGIIRVRELARLTPIPATGA